MNSRRRYVSHSAQATEDLGGRLAAVLPSAAIVYLCGGLGAGKTTLARGLLRGLGIEATVRSPTYSLIEPYDLGSRRVLHIDLYRVSDPLEVEELGLADYRDAGTLWVVEWPEHGGAALPAADLVIRLSAASTEERCLELEAYTPPGHETLAELSLPMS
jgi:tRNA threonylcarbamoyladenosine biosynthesis protein TsaE